MSMFDVRGPQQEHSAVRSRAEASARYHRQAQGQVAAGLLLVIKFIQSGLLLVIKIIQPCLDIRLQQTHARLPIKSRLRLDWNMVAADVHSCCDQDLADCWLKLGSRHFHVWKSKFGQKWGCIRCIQFS